MNDDIRDELLARGLSDMLQLGEIAWVARRGRDGTPDEAAVIRAATESVGELLSSGHAIVGDVGRDEGRLSVQSWGVSTAETLKRIEDEWRALGHMPNNGDVCWLELTDAGREEARTLAS